MSENFEGMIPPEQLEFCRAVMQLAKAHGCTQVGLTYRLSPFHQPDGHARWNEQIEAGWHGERHNENERLHVSSTLRTYTNIRTADGQPWRP